MYALQIVCGVLPMLGCWCVLSGVCVYVWMLAVCSWLLIVGCLLLVACGWVFVVDNY